MFGASLNKKYGLCCCHSTNNTSPEAETYTLAKKISPISSKICAIQPFSIDFQYKTAVPRVTRLDKDFSNQEFSNFHATDDDESWPFS